MDTHDDSCLTKYPFVFVHGAALRDWDRFNYWGRIPSVLASHGCRFYYGNQDGWASIENNADTLKARITEVLRESGADKVNIIAHSKGGIESRHLISSLGMADVVASLTTVSTPHRGVKTMDLLLKFPNFWFRIVSFFANRWFRWLGDRSPDFHFLCRQLSATYMDTFNQNNPDVDGVYYQSYAGAMRNSFSDMLLFWPHFFVGLIEGENDGLVPTSSAPWGNFKGFLRGATNRGVSHADEVDIRRRRLTKKTREGCVSDICDVYVQIIEDLKQLGY